LPRSLECAPRLAENGAAVISFEPILSRCGQSGRAVNTLSDGCLVTSDVENTLTPELVAKLKHIRETE
jgi:hypothetical protein